MNTYGITIWSDSNFVIDSDKVHVNHKSSPSLLDITAKVRQTGLRGPLILRFPHLIQKQITTL